MSFWSNTRVTVTGGTGFIATHVVEALRQRGAEVFPVAHREFDLTREPDVERLFAQHPADIVVHLAGLIGGILAIKERPAEFIHANLLMNAHVLHHAWKNNVRKVVSIGAGCGYPTDAPTPLREDSLWDGSPQVETAPYALAKRLLSVQSDAYAQQYGFVGITVIPGNVYGPFDNFNLHSTNVVPALIRKFVEATERGAPSVEVWGSGRAARDFVYVADLADGMLAATERLDASTLINISSGEETPIRRVVEILTQVTGFRGEVAWNTPRPDGQLHRRLDTARAEQLLGWKAGTSLEEGLRITVEWYRANQDKVRK